LLSFIIRKLAYSLFILWGVISLIFLLFFYLPADPARMMLGQRADAASLHAIHQDLGLDQPKWKQYLKYINDLSPISVHNTNNRASYFYYDTSVYSPSFKVCSIFGKCLVIKYPYLRRSYQSGKNVSGVILETLPNTLILALAAIFFASILGILFGVLSAKYKNSILDRVTILFSTMGVSLPSFFAAIIVGWLFAYVLGKYTGLNITGNLMVMDNFGEDLHAEWKNLILPAFTLGMRPLGVIIQLTRNSMLDTLSMDFIRTARAKGLNERSVLWRHALRNSLNPVVTAISGWFASMLAGVVFIEYIFGWKGLGYIVVDALGNFDLPVVLGCVLTISMVFIIVNFLVDISYSFLDPRIRLI
jgi:peptide/nickel transport system permease protein